MVGQANSQLAGGRFLTQMYRKKKSVTHHMSPCCSSFILHSWVHKNQENYLQDFQYYPEK